MPTICSDIQFIETRWRGCIPPETVFDLWEVRLAFHRQYRRPLRMVYTADCTTFLPLAWVEERQAWCCFPGETWHHKTWLEQNRLLCGALTTDQMTETVGADLHLRYLRPEGAAAGLPVDDTGYLFIPGQYGYRLENWWNSFSTRRRKQLRRELKVLDRLQCRIGTDCENRFDWLVDHSMERFGQDSYFSDPRFREGFHAMLALLADRGLLRVTTILDGTTIAAVDVGAVYNQRYTLLAGAATTALPGVAKLINLQHLQWACEEQLQEVDFLCGDCSWKSLFHLTARPLPLFSSAAVPTVQQSPETRSTSHAEHPHQ